jgi:hypothetical protein
MPWYRLGVHTGHVLVTDQGFSANDLLQGRVGDCWFLSALAVIAERPDLIWRLFPKLQLNSSGMILVNLFLDGYWKAVVMDDFLPCLIDNQTEEDMHHAIQASLKTTSTQSTTTTTSFSGVGQTLNGITVNGNNDEELSSSPSASSSSTFDPHALCDKNRQVLTSTQEFLQRDCPYDNASSSSPRTLQRLVRSEDLAYSKAKKNQLWVVRNIQYRVYLLVRYMCFFFSSHVLSIMLFGIFWCSPFWKRPMPRVMDPIKPLVEVISPKPFWT